MKKVICFFEYLLAFFIVINCNTIWARLMNENINLILTIICLLTINILLFIPIMNKINKKFLDKMTFILIGLNIYNFIFILMNETNEKQYFIRFVVILSLLIFYIGIKRYYDDYLSVIYKLSDIIVLLAVISLIFYFLGSILHLINSNENVLIIWGGERYVPSYYKMYFETQNITLFGIKLIRNSGIFTEAPMFNFVLCISLVIEFFLKDDKSKKRIAILILTIITTATTTGIAVMSFLIVLNKMLETKEGLLRNLLKYTLVLIITVILLAISIAFINDKINGSRGKVGSFSVRMDDYKIGFEVLNDYKLHGVGFLNNDFVKRNYMNLSERGTDAGGSNSIMIILSQGGLYLSVIYLLAIISSFIKSLKYKQKKC